MKKIFLILIVMSQSVFALTLSQKIMYARLHADNLLSEFDHELDIRLATNNKTALFDIPAYQKLLATRIYLENLDNHEHDTKAQSILLAHDFKAFEEVKKEIKVQSEALGEKAKSLKSQNDNLVIYPSTGSDGNITGNTYPKNVWSLTFDDGPHKTRTNTVLDNLNEFGMKATFFVLVEKAKIYKSITNDIINSSMELALHSYSHADLSKTTSNLTYEITNAKKILEEQTNQDIKVFRLPYGAGMRTTRVRQVIKDNDMIHIFWNIDTLDWQDKNPNSIFERTKKMMALTPNNSGVILFHDIHNQSVIASKLVMEYLKNEKKTVCTVSEVINYFNHKKQDCINE